MSKGPFMDTLVEVEAGGLREEAYAAMRNTISEGINEAPMNEATI